MEPRECLHHIPQFYLVPRLAVDSSLMDPSIAII
jgi:hypothetical protein